MIHYILLAHYTDSSVMGLMVFEDEELSLEVLGILTSELVTVPASSELFTDVDHFSVAPIQYHVGDKGIKQVIATLTDGMPF